MVCVVISLFLLCFACKCSAHKSSDGMIFMEIYNNIATAKRSTLLYNKPFTIVITSISNQVHNITNIKCHFSGNEHQIFTKNENGKWDPQKRVYTVQEGKAENKMNSYWNCTITYYDFSIMNLRDSHLHFKVTVKNKEFVKHGEIFVNDVLIQTKQEDKAIERYEHSDGEIVKVSCKKHNAPFMNMSYFDGNSFHTIPTSSSTDQTMYLKMRDGKKAYVQCNVELSAASTEPDVQSIRLDFIKRSGSSDLPTFNVNGLTLAPTLAAKGKYYKLFYEYYDGEFINLTVSNEKGWANSSALEQAELNGDKPIYSDGQKKIKFFNSNKHKTINFDLIPAPKFNAMISGLPFSQTDLKYLYKNTTYRTVFFNKKNNILNLTCSSSGHENCKWDQNLTMKNATSLNNVTFLPKEHTNQSTVISCMCAKYIHEVTILRDDDSKQTRTEGPQGKEETGTSDGTTTDSGNEYTTGKMMKSSGDDSTPGGISPYMLVVIIVVVLIVVAAVVWLMVGLYKRRQRREKAIQSEFNYESLENTTERTMPPPAQWDTYSQPIDRQKDDETDNYSVPYQERNVEDMYAKPLPKSLRKPTNESMYTEPSYATVEQLGEKPTYGNLSNQTAEYSQIQPKKLIGNPNAPKVLPSESPYAEVLPNAMRPDKESSKYANVFDNQRYVNSDNGKSGRDASEYAEPAYCEIGYKNK